MSEPVLKLQDLCKSFQSAGEELVILNNLELIVEKDSRTAITGESGCGKSTLLNIIGGLESPTSGSVFAGPFDVHVLDEKALSTYRSSYLGLVFQFHYLLKDFTALENVMLPAYMAGMKKKEAFDRARMLLADVKLENRMEHYPAQLSGGERQRAAVARALINNPTLVLADEPTGNLDPANSGIVKELLFSVVTRYHSALILVTHDYGIASLADSCYRLQNGKLVRQ